MAASLVKNLRLCATAKKALAVRASLVNQTWTRTAFFWQGKDKGKDSEVPVAATEDDQLLPTAAAIAKPLRKREGLQTVRGYSPPGDVEARVHEIASDMYGETKDWLNYSLDNNTDKFKFLSRVMSEFDHYIPNADLSNIQSVGDVVVFFSTPVRDTTSYEDLSKLDLPPNLHIQMDPVRFDPETDTMFGGVTAFPDRPTVISSLKFRRKYGKKDKE